MSEDTAHAERRFCGSQNIVENYLADIAKNRISYIAKKLHISMEEMADAWQRFAAVHQSPAVVLPMTVLWNTWYPMCLWNAEGESFW